MEKIDLSREGLRERLSGLVDYMLTWEPMWELSTWDMIADYFTHK